MQQASMQLLHEVFRGSKEAHYSECTFWHCTHCRKRGIPNSQQLEHIAACSVLPCPSCRQKFDEDELAQHVQHCQFRLCEQFDYPILINQYDKHLQDCSTWRCRNSNCRKRFPLDKVEEHKGECINTSHLQPYAKTWGPEVIRRVLSPALPFPVAPGVDSIRKAPTQTPLNTVVIDFEFLAGQSSMLFPGHSKLPFEIAMSNFNGECIINTTINYNVSTRSMLKEGNLLKDK